MKSLVMNAMLKRETLVLNKSVCGFFFFLITQEVSLSITLRATALPPGTYSYDMRMANNLS